MSECPSHAAERWMDRQEAEADYLMDILMDAFHAHRDGNVNIDIQEADWKRIGGGYAGPRMNVFTISFEATPMQIAEWEYEEERYKEMMKNE